MTVNGMTRNTRMSWSREYVMPGHGPAAREGAKEGAEDGAEELQEGHFPFTMHVEQVLLEQDGQVMVSP